MEIRPPKIVPKKSSPIWKSEKKDDLLSAYSDGISQIVDGFSTGGKVVEKLVAIDMSLRVKRLTKDVSESVEKLLSLKALAKTESKADVERVMKDEELRRENIGGIRRGAAAAFHDAIAGVLEDKEKLLDLSVADLKKVGELYKIVRDEEDRQTALDLKRKADAREDVKFKMLCFDFISGKLGPEDIQFLNEDLRESLQFFLDGNPEVTTRKLFAGTSDAPSGAGVE